jgi:class 3 adenylate cyclase/DNA-binding SARP family transcriptional activator
MTVLLTDLVGSTELQSALGDRQYARVRRTHDRLVEAAVRSRSGRIFKSTGDGALAVFESAADAIDAAVAIQHAAAAAEWPEGGPCEIRIALSAGDVRDEGGDYFGRPVVEVARIEEAAGAGEIVATELVDILAAGRDDNPAERIGPRELRGIPGSVTLVRIVPRAATVPDEDAGRAEPSARDPGGGASTKIQICGSVAVQVDGRRVDALPGRQGVLLLVYLAANRARFVTRDELIEALWQRKLPARPDSALSVLLSKLRGVLGPDSIEGRSEVRLALSPVLIDFEAATDGVHDAECAIGLDDWAGAWGPARVALHTARRGFLPGFDAPWITELRDRLDDIRIRSLVCIAESSLHLGGPELPSAERAARELVRTSPYRETGYRLLMETLSTQGDTAEALLVYEGLRRLLRDELGAAPSAQLRALHQELLEEGAAARE